MIYKPDRFETSQIDHLVKQTAIYATRVINNIDNNSIEASLPIIKYNLTKMAEHLEYILQHNKEIKDKFNRLHDLIEEYNK